MKMRRKTRILDLFHDEFAKRAWSKQPDRGVDIYEGSFEHADTLQCMQAFFFFFFVSFLTTLAMSFFFRSLAALSRSLVQALTPAAGIILVSLLGLLRYRRPC